jgi:cytoskeletal protein RodZ
VFEIGKSLQEARERQARTFSDLERKTQIRTRYLRAIEEEKFSLLPAPAYVRGFLRVYADELGLDGQLYVDEFNSRYPFSEEGYTTSERRERRVPVQAHHSRHVATGAVAISLAVIVGVSLLIIAAFTSKSPNPSVANLPQQTTSAATSVKVTAVRGDSTVDVREGDENGRPIFGGTLVKGRSKTVKGSSLWIRVGAIQNLRWTLPDGSTITAGSRVGPADVLFTPSEHRFLTG